MGTLKLILGYESLGNILINKPEYRKWVWIPHGCTENKVQVCLKCTWVWALVHPENGILEYKNGVWV